MIRCLTVLCAFALGAPGVKVNTVKLEVTERGIEPAGVTVRKGQPLRLRVTRKTEQTCATELVIPDYHLQKKLPLNQEVEFDFTPEKSGELAYGCAMGMMVKAVLRVE